MKLETALLFDVETTGTDPAKDRVLEVGVGLFSIPDATLVRAASFLFHAEENPAEFVNGLSPALLARFGTRGEGDWSEVADWFALGDVIVAHHASFDRSFVPRRLMEVEEPGPWVCSMDDIEWPRTSPNKSLVGICLAHGLGVGSAHRALEDVLLLVRLFERAAELGADLTAMMERALRPKKKYRAFVSYDDRELAKAAGFAWDGDAKIWHKRIVPEDLAELALPFEVREIVEAPAR